MDAGMVRRTYVFARLRVKHTYFYVRMSQKEGSHVPKP